MAVFPEQIRTINFPPRYSVSYQDMLDLQMWLQQRISYLSTAFNDNRGQCVLSGLEVTFSDLAGDNFRTTISPGRAVFFGGNLFGLCNAIAWSETGSTIDTATGGVPVTATVYSTISYIDEDPVTTELGTSDFNTRERMNFAVTLGSAPANSLILATASIAADGSLISKSYATRTIAQLGIKKDSQWTQTETNPTEIVTGSQLVHYNITLTDDLTVTGTLITGNLTTTGFTLDSTGGMVVSQF